MFTVRELNWKQNTKLLTKEGVLAGLNEMIRMGVEMFDRVVCGDVVG